MVIRNQDVQSERAKQFIARQQTSLNNKTLTKKLDNRQKSTIRTLCLQIAVLALVFGGLAFVHIVKGDTKLTAKSVAAAGPQTQSVPQVDQLVTTNIAATVAQAIDLPVAPSIVNQADSLKAQAAMHQDSDTATITKPQTVATAAQSDNTVQTYRVKKGDSVASLSKKFDISADTIKWANDLASDSLTPGQTLKILPTDGVLYKVKSGDTPESIAKEFSSNSDLIVSFNDAELTGLKTNQQIIIPSGVKPVDPTPAPTYPTEYASSDVQTQAFTPVYSGNGYGYGYCTYYVASMVRVPNNWGNANTWAYYARLSGWNVGSTPSVGAIAQTSVGWAGHVALVTGVSSDGQSVTISEMNGTAGWNVVDTRTVPVGSFVYISH